MILREGPNNLVKKTFFEGGLNETIKNLVVLNFSNILCVNLQFSNLLIF